MNYRRRGEERKRRERAGNLFSAERIADKEEGKR